MRDPLVIAAAQPVCVPDDVAANATAPAAVARSASAGVVVFPELSITGYELDVPAITATALVGAPIAGGPHIAVLAVDGGSATVAYRKIWLGTAEAERFAPGDAPAPARRAVATPSIWSATGELVSEAGSQPGTIARASLT